MMHSISNKLLTIQVSPKGAELRSIQNKETGIEYLWCAGKEWPKKSPVLFPIVGGLKGNTYIYQGKQYNLPRHGFAREKEFTLESQSDNKLVYALQSSEETKKIYPFDFKFTITYILHSDTDLEIIYGVENLDKSSPLFYSVGAHPAFAVPLSKDLKYEDFYLQFSEIENADRWPLDAAGLIKRNPQKSYLNNTNKLNLKKELFEEDAIVFKNLASNSITIASDKTPHGLKVSYKGFPFMGIWAAKNADFVCIEPWKGIADWEDSTGELESKEGILRLDGGSKTEHSFSIKFF